jgi:nucleotide-binding universal stress UspA family protein
MAAPRNFRRILVATDLSPASRPAVDYALELARAWRAELVILHVVAPPAPLGTDAMVFPRVYEELEAQMRSDGERRLRRLLKLCRAAKVPATAVLARGVPDRQILRSAASRRADLLVLGTHGRTGLARVFLGSVASRVAASAACPVLTVPSRGRSRRARREVPKKTRRRAARA